MNRMSKSVETKRNMQSGGCRRNTWVRVAVVMTSGLLWSIPSVSGAYAASSSTDTQTAMLQAMTNTTSQPVLQIIGSTSFNYQYVDEKGQTQGQKESDTFSAQMEMDNGGYDELLKDSSTGTFGNDSNLYILGDDTFYYQQGKAWDKGGTISSNTLQEETPLLQGLENVVAGPSSNGGVEYSGSLSAGQIVSLIDNYIMMGQSNTAYDNLADHITNESKSLVSVVTSTFNGKPVVDEVRMNLAVALSTQDTISVLGVTGDTSKVQPEQINFAYDFKNTFNQTTFPSPVTGKTPPEQLVSATQDSGSASTGTGSSSTGSTSSSSPSTSSSSGTSSSTPTKQAKKLPASEVTRAYLNAYGRDAYSNEVSKWTAVDNLTYDSLMQKLRQVIRTDEGIRKNIIVTAYFNAFGRSADSAELKYWDNRMKSSGEDYTDLMGDNRQYIKGNEAIRKFMIGKSYLSVFWRGPNSDEMKYWDNRLRSTGMDFQELMSTNKTSFRDMQVMRDGAIDNAYLEYIGTAPTAAERQYWTNKIKNGSITTYQDLFNQMDAPMRQEIKTSDSVRQAMINNSYWTVFWRGPDAAEAQYWDNQLESGKLLFRDLLNDHIAFLRDNEPMRTAAINNAHMVLIGRNAVGSELKYWTQQFQSGSIETYQDLYKQVQSVMQEKSALQDDIIQRAYQWSFGRAASSGEVKYWEKYFKNGQVNYSELIKLNRDYITRDEGTRSAMIKSSYEQVFHRAPTGGEFKFWDDALKKYGDTYTELITAHQTWLKANQSVLHTNDALQANLAKKGLRFDAKTGDLLNIKTGKVALNSGDYLIGKYDKNGNLIGLDGTGVIAAGGGNVIATGGGNVIATGGGNVIAAGGGNVIATGGGNVIAAGGGNVIAAGGGNVIAAGGGNVIAEGGGNVIAAGGGNVITAGGGNMIQIDGGAMLNPGLIALQNGSNVIAAGGGNVITAGGGN